MSRLRGLLTRLRNGVRPGDTEGRMEEEFRFHLEMEQARLMRAGSTTSTRTSDTRSALAVALTLGTTRSPRSGSE